MQLMTDKKLWQEVIQILKLLKKLELYKEKNILIKYKRH